MRPTLEAVAHEDGLASPRVGRVTLSVRRGEFVVPGQRIGTLAVVEQRFDLLAPPGRAGRVVAVASPAAGFPVAFGQTLVTLDASAGVDAAEPGEHELQLREGQRRITAAMDGMFYLRATPDAPPFVSVGDRLEPGTTFGLVEVMKFFYPVAFEGDAPVEVVEIVARDGGPVEAGDTLLVVERVG